jgi:hypothetical protein
LIYRPQIPLVIKREEVTSTWPRKKLQRKSPRKKAARKRNKNSFYFFLLRQMIVC